jgi:17beta-estradiol 17-dehydrogenase / very-long-chain 3-oxoacyl-CoA reductase
LVTGASDGIGKQYAVQLAKAGFNLILVSRTASKLQNLSSEITSSNSDIRIEILAMDFSKNQDSDYDKLAAMVKDKDIAILINNVGQSHDLPVPYALTPEDEVRNIITTNCIGTLKVTRLVLPGMSSRKRGLILTMGSFGGLLPTPLLATYSGSKGFLQNWSTALASEVEELGITVYFVQAYVVTSAMSKVRRSTYLFPSEKDFVKSTLARIGNRCGSVGYAYSGTPWWSHALFAWYVLTVGYPFGYYVVGQNLVTHKQIRARALRKAEKLSLEAKKGT